MKQPAVASLAAACLSLALTSAQAQTKWDLPSGYGANTFQVQTSSSSPTTWRRPPATG